MFAPTEAAAISPAPVAPLPLQVSPRSVTFSPAIDTTRKLKCIVVRSDPTAGGRNENEDICILELECPVSMNPSKIARALGGEGPDRGVFCTYPS